MCQKKYHKCRCGKEYDCSYPDFACPTVNEDEDMNQCDECLEKFAQDYAKAYYQRESQIEYFEDEEFEGDEDE